MKNKLRLSYSILFGAVIIGVLLSVNGGSPWIISGLMLAVILSTVLTINLWLDFVMKLVAKSNQSLSKKGEGDNKWSFSNLENLEKNQEQVLFKISRSAELISNLTHPEKVIADPLYGADDPIGHALKSITAEMQKIKEEDHTRGWVTQGLAQFSTILRHKGEVKEYGYDIISNLVKYLNANQGSLYIEYRSDENERYIELMASYAYNKRKYQEDRIYEGQGVLGRNAGPQWQVDRYQSLGHDDSRGG